MNSPEPKSPLTIIAIFAGIIEASALASLPFLGEDSQSIYTWFLVGFPPFLTLLFFLTLNFNTKSLYSPDELSSEAPVLEDSNAHPGSDAREVPPKVIPRLTSEITDSTVVISGPNSKTLLEVLAGHAVRTSETSCLILHDLENGTRTTITTDITPDRLKLCDRQKKPRQ